MPTELSRRNFVLTLGALAMTPVPFAGVGLTPRTFTREKIDALRRSIPISRIIGRTVKLERCGYQHRGVTPFANARHPSFLVDDKHRFFHCFETGLHGDVFAFVMKAENTSKEEAIKRVALEASRWMPRAPA